MDIFAPLGYLKLENAYGKAAIRRDIIPLLIIVLVISVPFVIINDVNYFHKDGFLDKISTFSSVLTGFYVAALIAIATLSAKFADLDEPISNGVVRKRVSATDTYDLNRREYVCYMFGYMAYLSLALTLISICLVDFSSAFGPFVVHLDFGNFHYYFSYLWIRAILIFGISIPISSLFITTARGLYYLVERIYETKPTVDQDKEI